MRKSIWAAVIMMAGGSFAAMAPIEGNNAVGVLAVTTPGASSKTLTVPYEQCLGNGEITLSELVSTYGRRASASAETADEADRLVVLMDHEGTQEFWYYYNNTESGWTPVISAQLQPNGTSVAVEPLAADQLAVARGLGFWIQCADEAAGSVFLKGQVANTPQVTVIKPGLNLVGIATTSSVSLNEVDWTGAFGADKLLQSDTLVVDNAEGLPGLYYFDKVSGKWVDRQYKPAEVTFSGSAFWYNRKGEGTFTFQPDGQE